MYMQTKMLRAALVLAIFGGSTLNYAVETSRQQDSTGTVTTVNGNIRSIILSEQKIEGKIRRPQLVLIQADQRPHFTPMVMQVLDKSSNAAELVDPSALEPASCYDAFQFDGTKITGLKP